MCGSEVDRVYGPTPPLLKIADRQLGRQISIDKTGFPDAVVWNLWVEKTKSLADMPDDDYHKFVCVEVVSPSLVIPDPDC